jgi:hypothetical protein
MITVSVLLLLPLAKPAWAQIVYGQPASGDLQIVFTSWSLDEDGSTTDLTQFATPVRGFLPLGDNSEAMIYFDNSSNKLETAAAEAKLSGLGDLRLQLSKSFSEDHFVAGLGINLPTGKHALDTEEETLVLNMLAQNYLSMPMRRFGQGLGITATLGAAQMVYGWRCGAGLSYQYNGKYDPYENVSDYDPGDVISVNAGLDRQFGQAIVALELVFSAYAADKLDGDEVFKQSTQVSAGLGVTHDTERHRVNGSLGYLARGRNDLFTGDDSRLKIYGNEFRVGASWLVKPSMSVAIGPTAEFRSIAANDLDFGSSSVIQVGLLSGFEMSESLSLDVGGRYYTGTVDGGDIDLTGLQLNIGIVARR